MKSFYRTVAGLEVFHRMVSDPQVASDLAFHVVGSTGRVSDATTDIRRVLTQLRSAIPYTFERRLADKIFTTLSFEDRPPPMPSISIPPLIAPAIWIGFETPVPLTPAEIVLHESVLNAKKKWERGEVLGFLFADEDGTPVVTEFVSDGYDMVAGLPLWICRYAPDDSTPPAAVWWGPRDYFPWRIHALIQMVQDPTYDIAIEQIKTSYALRREREQAERRTKTNLSGLTVGYTVRSTLI
jgi:hypothetical protein